MKLGENIEHDMGHLSVLEFRGNLLPVMSIGFFKLALVSAGLSSKKIMMWMRKVLFVIQVKKIQKLYKDDDNTTNAVHK